MAVTMMTLEASRKWNATDKEQLKQYGEICEQVHAETTEALAFVNTRTQMLHFVLKQKFHCSFPISTAKNGEGSIEGSGMTPLGLHSVKERFGDGADPFAVFKSRVATGELAVPVEGGDAIIGRILRLHGLQPGINQGMNAEGKNVDSFERYIYIHGTNDIAHLGQPASAGCVRMHPDGVVQLFELMPSGSHVFLYRG